MWVPYVHISWLFLASKWADIWLSLSFFFKKEKKLNLLLFLLAISLRYDTVASCWFSSPKHVIYQNVGYLLFLNRTRMIPFSTFRLACMKWFSDFIIPCLSYCTFFLHLYTDFLYQLTNFLHKLHCMHEQRAMYFHCWLSFFVYKIKKYFGFCLQFPLELNDFSWANWFRNYG